MIKEVSLKELNRPPAFFPVVIYCPYIPVMVTKVKGLKPLPRNSYITETKIGEIDGIPVIKQIIKENYWLPPAGLTRIIQKKYDTMNIKEANPFKSEILKLRI